MAAPARQAVAKAVDRSSLLYKLKRWYYYKCYYPEVGLRTDDTILESSSMAPIIEEALKRIPKEELDARNYRLLRAHQLSMMKVVLPRDQWTVYEDDTPYLMPYIEEIKREIEERKEWDSA